MASSADLITACSSSSHAGAPAAGTGAARAGSRLLSLPGPPLGCVSRLGMLLGTSLHSLLHCGPQSRQAFVENWAVKRQEVSMRTSHKLLPESNGDCRGCRDQTARSRELDSGWAMNAASSAQAQNKPVERF